MQQAMTLTRKLVTVLVSVVIILLIGAVFYIAIMAGSCGTSQTWSFTKGCYPDASSIGDGT